MRSFPPLATAAALIALHLHPSDADGRPPPMPCERERPQLDTSSWLRLGAAWGRITDDGALASTRAPGERDLAFDVGFAAALGLDATLGLASRGDLRFGPWGEVAFTDFDTATPSGGIELQLGRMPDALRWFQYSGQGQLTARVGVGHSFGPSLPSENVVVGALTWGYLAPWDLFGDRCHDDGGWLSKRYMIGARVVATVMHSMDAPEFWLATVGIEVEPVGAIRYLFGIRDWY